VPSLAVTALLPVQQPIANPFTDAVQFWSTIAASIEFIAHELATAFIPTTAQPTATNKPNIQRTLHAPTVAATRICSSRSGFAPAICNVLGKYFDSNIL
jgi:hypothetical protein